MKTFLAIVAVLAIAAPPAANALYLDFTKDDPWADADLKKQYLFQDIEPGLDLLIEGYYGNKRKKITHNWPDKPELGLDGFGIKGQYQNDEVDPYEYLTLTFSEPVRIISTYLSDLYGPEQAEIKFDGITRTGPAYGVPNGYVVLSFGSGIIAREVEYWCLDLPVPDYNDYSVAGIGYVRQSIPEPATALMVGLGLMFVGLLRRRVR